MSQDTENVKRLIAKDVALISKEGDGFKLLDLELKDKGVLKEVTLSLVDALNSAIIFKPKR